MLQGRARVKARRSAVLAGKAARGVPMGARAWPRRGGGDGTGQRVLAQLVGLLVGTAWRCSPAGIAGRLSRGLCPSAEAGERREKRERE